MKFNLQFLIWLGKGTSTWTMHTILVFFRLLWSFSIPKCVSMKMLLFVQIEMCFDGFSQCHDKLMVICLSSARVQMIYFWFELSCFFDILRNYSYLMCRVNVFCFIKTFLENIDWTIFQKMWNRFFVFHFIKFHAV